MATRNTRAVPAPVTDPSTSYALLKLDEASVEVLRAALQEHFAAVAGEGVQSAADAEERLARLAHVTELIRLLEDLSQNGAAQSTAHHRADEAPPVTGKVGRGLGSLLPSNRDAEPS